MIKGLGVDIVKISRIEGLLTRYGASFASKVFTPHEIDYCGAMAFPALHFAGRWAAKEAFYKALPSQCQRLSTWKSIEVVSDRGSAGRPAIVVRNPALDAGLKECGITAVHISISHEKEMCVAAVALA
jgi:holo-[acyl-carrier protein] synthase